MSQPELSYHDVTVYVGCKAYIPSENYALELICTKAGGWQLWQRWDGHEVQLGGEFHGEPFAIEVAGTMVCGERPTVIEMPAPFGWDGVVDTAL